MKRSIWLVPSLVSLLVVFMLVGCTSGRAGDPGCTDDDCGPDTGDESRVCAAIRGNGELISSHFASLARIIEHYGIIDGAAGGSSASITIFLTESILMNPLIRNCGGQLCSDADSAARAALLLKSFPGYLAHLTTTDEAVAFFQLQSLLAKLDTQNIENLLETDVGAALDALETLLTSTDLGDLINPEVLTTVQESSTPAFHVADIVEGIKNIGSFSVDSAQILIRPGIINFAGLGEKFGRAASFYAGYGPADNDAMASFLDHCAVAGRGLDWFFVQNLDAGGVSCGVAFDTMLGEYRSEFIANEGQYHSRIDDSLGIQLPVLVSTSVLTGAAATAFAEARVTYGEGIAPTLNIDFADVRFGYWGRSQDLALSEENRNGYTDLKSQKFLALGQATWRTVLSYSPAEPGLARGLELPDGQVSTGGWSDLHPVLVLTNMECDEVVYVTREGEESGFAIGVARHLGLTEADRMALFDLDQPTSSYSLSLSEAGATWCTNWNAVDAFNLPAITADGFNAPMESDRPFFVASETRYPGARSGLAKRGCTPGAL